MCAKLLVIAVLVLAAGPASAAEMLPAERLHAGASSNQIM